MATFYTFGSMCEITCHPDVAHPHRAQTARSPIPAVPLTLPQLEQVLDEYLDAVLSSRRTSVEVACNLVSLTPAQQQFALHWTDVIRKSNSEMAYQFACHIPAALAALGMEGTRMWVLQAMDIYDKEGLYPGSAALARIEEFAYEYQHSHAAITLDEVRPVLSRFIRGLSGRDLKLTANERVYTDTDTLYLPARIQHFASRKKNYRLYKAIAVHLWAQSWFGTFRRATPSMPHLAQRIAEFDDSHLALKLFNALETIRLNACITRELPGLAREIGSLHTAPPHDATWQAFSARLEHPESTVEDTFIATTALYSLQTRCPQALLYQSELDLEAVQITSEKRLATEKSRLQNILRELLAKHPKNADGKPETHQEPTQNQSANQDNPFQITNDENRLDIQLKLDGEAVVPPGLDNILSSILQDLAQLPQDWLVPAGHGEYDRTALGADAENAPPEPHPQNTFRYDEWDFRRQSYRKNWCALREIVSHPVYDDFTEQTLHKYLPLITEIRRHFEALRGEDKRHKAQSAGDNIDLDALITAHADAHTGVEMSERIFTRMHKSERSLAAMFMVDVSGSTKGWINDAIRESLTLLCEALEILGDQYAIYGFSGMTRNRCEIYQVKTFAQPYDRTTRARISGLRPQDYTRMGVAIRHLSKILNACEARTRMLITLSDGKPDDYDNYRGEYGIADTRQALLEARHARIHPFCITIDTTASDYLPQMYGPVNYVVVDEVRKLPLKVADIYRKLTT